MKKWIAMALALLMFAGLRGCGRDNTAETDTSAAGSTSSTDAAAGSDTATATQTAETDFSQTDADMFTDRDYAADYDESSSVRIELNGSSAAASSDSVQISGSTVTITEEATYIISGTLDDGMIIVNAPDTAKLQLVLNGVEINSATSAALYILEADKVFVTLAAGTENILSNGGSFTAIDDNNIDGVIFSKQDLTLNGAGSLTVTSPAGHGIVCKDDLVITGGAYTVTAASHGLDANDSVRITGDTAITVDAGKDGIHAENNDDASLGFVYIAAGRLDLEAEGDGVSAGAYMQIMGGTFQILAGGGSANGSKESSDAWGGFRGGRPGQSSTTETTDDSSTSMKGLKSAGSMLIADGSFTIDAADDAVHSNASITVNGGDFAIASGDDAFHTDDTLTVAAGTIHITESYEGLEALHVNVQGGDITLTEYREGDTSVYVADVQVSSAAYLRTALANRSYGRNVTQKTSEMAEENNAILAVNGDYYGSQETGYVLRNGVLYRDTPSDGQEDLVVYADGSFAIVNESDVSADRLLAEGAEQVLSFGPALVTEGQVAVTADEEVGKAQASNPRTAIGVVDDLHYLFVVSDGRTDASEGLFLYELAVFMQSLGAETAYNLDGGGSSTLYFNGEVINHPTTSGRNIREREVSDIVYIGY